MSEKKKILVVDDDPDLLYFMKLILSMNGYMVRTLVDGLQVFEKLEEELPDLVILDINLGNCLGTDLCASLKTKNIYKHIPVILYSANKYSADIHRTCHADAYFEKPFTNDFLLQTVKSFFLQ